MGTSNDIANESVDRIHAAVDAHARFLEGEFGDDIERFLGEHEDLRELLEPMVRETGPALDAVGDYELVREVGRGGMGVVYEARQRSLDKRVALKLLAPFAVGSDRAMARFRREAVLAAGLEHDHIARVIAFGVDDGVCHLAMEFVEGTPLDEVLARLRDRADGPPNDVASFLSAADCELTAEADATAPLRSYVEVILRIGAQLASALEHAHVSGVLHRDVKPGNVLIDRQGHAVLTDFGLAREMGRDGFTRTGEFAGTLEYATPEQLEGDAVGLDGRADVFALGALLYECLTLERPFAGRSESEVRENILRREPLALQRSGARVSRDVAAVVHRALEKRPADRYGTAAEFGLDLRRALQGEPVGARPVSSFGKLRRWTRRHPKAAGAISVIVSVTIVAIVALGFALWNAERYQTIRLGRALTELQARSDVAYPAWPERVEELRALVAEIELLPAQRGELVRRIASLRDSGGSRSFFRSPEHPLASRIADLEVEHARLLRDVQDPGITREVAKEGRAWARSVESTLERLRQRVAASEAAAFGSREDAFVHDELERQLEQLDGLVDVALPWLRSQLEWAAGLADSPKVEVSQRWLDAAERVRSSPAYGFELIPQTGLFPLGPDPESGLEEFAHLRSFAPEARQGLERPLEFSADSGIVFVLMPAGRLRVSETASKEIDPFLFGKHELSRGQWSRLAEDQRGLRLFDGGILDLRNLSQPEKPANGVTWTMVSELLRRHGLRLPRQLEWHWADLGSGRPVRSEEEWRRTQNVKDRAYAFMNRSQTGNAPFVDGYPGLAPVWAMEADGFGLHQLLGNVEEWCEDAWQVSEQNILPGVPTNRWSPSVMRITRGFGWNSYPEEFPAGSRLRPERASQGFANRAIGARAARSLQR